MLRISLLTIGDELLIGQVLNSNAKWMSEALTDLGWSVRTHLTVGDQKSEIISALNFLSRDSDAVVISGGLGPTHDDITIEVLSEHFQIPLVEDTDWLSQVKNYFASRNRVMSENNRKQALLLKSATRIDNDCGTAAGQYFKHNSTEYFVLPGVPHEMKSMMNRFVLPKLATQSLIQGERILKTTLLTTGVGESALALRCAEVVKKIQSHPALSLAFLPSSTQVRLRLQMQSKNESDVQVFNAIKAELIQNCAADYFGEDPLTLEVLLVQELKKRGQTLAAAESCTGGYLAHRLTLTSGCSDVFRGSLVCYQNAIKTSVLGISADQIKTHGVVSEDIAKMMAELIRIQWNSDYGIGITGFLDEGLVWIALSSKENTWARKFNFEAHRERGKERATQAALDLLRRHFNDDL